MIRVGLACLGIVLLAQNVRAAGPCDACRSADEVQVGDYVEPSLPAPAPLPKTGDKGGANKIPLPAGAGAVHVKPGAGLWIGTPGEGRGDVFVNGNRDKASVGWRLGF